MEAVQHPELAGIVGALSPVPPPWPLSSFVGRRQEIDELQRILTGSRLVTLIGFGGSGKTRLAIELARSVSSSFDEGVAFVDLAPVHDPNAVAESIATAVGLTARAADQVAGLIGEESLLLVIDNAEHLVEVLSALVVEYLARCPGLRILVTSRQLLNVEGELSWSVAPLRVPPVDDSYSPVALRGYDAVELFCARAAEHQPRFGLSAANAPMVADICRHLDGIPLALELAAARVRSLALADIVKRLGDSFGLLTNGRRTPDTRHRSLRATMDWSYQLLEDCEQRLLRRLAVFAGTFDLCAVEVICSDPDIPTEKIPDVLRGLVDKSLVVTHLAADGSLRYVLIEVIRQYAQEQLLAAGDVDLNARHGAYYAGVAHRLNAVNLDSDSSAGLDFEARVETMTADYNNVRLAAGWSVTADPELHMAMVHDLQWYWVLRGAVREAHMHINAVLAAEHAHEPRLPGFYADAAKWSLAAGNLDATIEQIDRAAELVDHASDPRVVGAILTIRGMLAVRKDDFDMAERHFSQSVEHCEKSLQTATRELRPGLQHDLAVSLNNLAMAYAITGPLQEALIASKRAIDMTEDPLVWRGSLSRPAFVDTYGTALLACGRVSEAQEQFVSALGYAIRNRNWEAASTAMLGLACTASIEGRHVSCITLLAAAQHSARLAGGSLKRKHGKPHAEAERCSRSALGDETADVAWRQGLRMSPEAALALVRADIDHPPARPLSSRRLEIARLVARGFTDKEIAQNLLISKRTVETHLLQVRHQLGFSNRAQIAAWAASEGLLAD